MGVFLFTNKKYLRNINVPPPPGAKFKKVGYEQ